MENAVMLNAVCNEPVSLKVVQEPFYRKGFSPFVNKETGTWWEYDDDKKGFFDTGIIAQGRDGDTVDVRIDGESIVQDGVANVPKASEYTFGLVRTQNVDNATRGIYISTEGYLTAYNATTKNVNNRESQNSISPVNLDYAVKAAMCDGKGVAWTSDEQAAARERMGIYDAILSKDPIIVETLSEEVTEIKIDLPKPLRHIFITVENSDSARIYAGNGVLIEKGGTNGIILVTDKIAISTDQRAFAKIDIIAGCAFAYWGSAPEICQSTTFKFLNRIAMFENGISILRLDRGNSTTFPIGTTLKVWGC